MIEHVFYYFVQLNFDVFFRLYFPIIIPNKFYLNICRYIPKLKIRKELIHEMYFKIFQNKC